MDGHAVFPGTFDPLTVAHVAIADAVREELRAASVELVVSHVALGKEQVQAPVHRRLEAIRTVAGQRPWLRTRATEAQLLVDIAEGYDILVIGADKWHQLLDARFYGGSATARDAALARLPLLAVAPRAGCDVPTGPGIHVLSLPDELGHVSSTGVRAGRQEWRAEPG